MCVFENTIFPYSFNYFCDPLFVYLFMIHQYAKRGLIYESEYRIGVKDLFFDVKGLFDYNQKICATIVSNTDNVEVKTSTMYFSLPDNDFYKSTPINIKNIISYEYLMLDDMPIFFILPQNGNEFVSYFWDTEHSIPELYTQALTEWAKNTADKNLINSYLALVLDKIYEATDIKIEILYDELIENLFYSGKIEMNYSNIPDELIESLKYRFFNTYHEIIVDNILHEIIDDEANTKILDRYKLNDEYDLWEVYRENKDFRSDIDKEVEKRLNEKWEDTIKDYSIMEKILENYYDALGSAWCRCTMKKIKSIAFHNEIVNMVFKNPSYNSVTLDVKDISFDLPGFLVIKSELGIMNWLYGGLISLTGLSVHHVEYKKVDCRYNDMSITATRYGSIFDYYTSWLVVSDEDKIVIQNLKFDCLAPTKDTLSMNVKSICTLHANKMSLKTILKNTRLIFNIVIKNHILPKITKNILEAHPDLQREPFLASSIISIFYPSPTSS